jgi:hypothetical protein
VNEETQVRRAVCEAHGLPWTATRFLDGSTVAELEQSATRLAQLLGKEREPERELGLFERATIAKLERKRALVDVLTGRAQARDDQGRWAAKPAVTSFDSGARTPPPPPPKTHEQVLLEAMRSGESDVGGRF